MSIIQAFKVLPDNFNGFHVIELLDTRFKGCQFIYGGIEFDEIDPGLMHFDYEIVNGFIVEKEQMTEFVNLLGDIITHLIDKSLEHNGIVFKSDPVDNQPEI